MAASPDDTVYALASGHGRCAIAVIRVSGSRVRFVLETMVGRVPPPRYAAYVSVKDPDTRCVLDRAIVLFFPGPSSETGEDTAEFQVHGGRAVISSVLTALGRLQGVRLAEPGEFARRALRNGKMDLLEVEALADLIDAETEAQRRQAVEGGGLMLRGVAEAWRLTLLDLRADLEAGIDFADEDDVARHFIAQAGPMIDGLISEFERALARASVGERLREGFRVAVMGEPNAGKSSLLNALAGRDVAIVSDVAGTTRDRIDVFLDLKGYAVIVTDTAGLRESQDALEQEGIRRSYLAAEDADLILWLTPAGSDRATIPDHLQSKVKHVLSKADLDASPESSLQEPWARISIRTGNGIDGLVDGIAREAGTLFSDAEVNLVTRERHRLAISGALEALRRARQSVHMVELCADDIRHACLELERLLGRVDVEDVLGVIFSRFCIGK